MNKLFPASLRPYQRIIEATAIPVVLLSLKETQTELHQSKIGGLPYFPADYPVDRVYVPYPDTVSTTPWPKHSKTGKELMLLLQINFEEMPRMPSFPAKGILQLFVDDNNWHHLNEQLTAIYHPYVIRDKELLFTDFDVPSFKVKEHAISFQKETEYRSPSDFRFDKVFEQRELWKDYLSITDQRFSKRDTEPGYGRNKIGGYHYSQNALDPRASMPEWKDSILLAQFQDYASLSWGDCGSAQFFIKRKDLEHLNFNDLLFHWSST